MKELLKATSAILRADTELKTLARYTTKNKTIKRGYGTSGKWKSLVVFYNQDEMVKTDFTSKIRDIPLIVRAYDREDDLRVDDMIERVVELLEGADLSVPDKLHCYDCSYEGDVIALYWNNDLETYERVVRFKVVVRRDE